MTYVLGLSVLVFLVSFLLFAFAPEDSRREVWGGRVSLVAFAVALFCLSWSWLNGGQRQCSAPPEPVPAAREADPACQCAGNADQGVWL